MLKGDDFILCHNNLKIIMLQGNDKDFKKKGYSFTRKTRAT